MNKLKQNVSNETTDHHSVKPSESSYRQCKKGQETYRKLVKNINIGGHEALQLFLNSKIQLPKTAIHKKERSLSTMHQKWGLLFI